MGSVKSISKDAGSRARIAVPAGMILLLLCIAQFLDGMDVSSVGVTLPAIQRDLHLSTPSLQWIVSGYVLGYGGFLLLGGRIADIFGRRKVFLLSMFFFAVASLAGGLADNGATLIAARIVKGICAGFTTPAALSLLLGLYTDHAARHRAIGVLSSTGAAGFASGLLIGGLLGNISWRLTLLLPMVVALIVTIAGLLIMPPNKKSTHTHGRFDLLGALLITLSPLAIVYGATRAASIGWTSPNSLGAIIVGLVLLGIFLLHQSKTTSPLMPLSIFKRPGMTYGSIMAFFLQGNYIAFQFVSTLYYQNVLGWSPLQSGLAFIIAGCCVVFGAAQFAKLALKIGPTPLIVGGIASQVLSFVWTFLFIGKLDIIPFVLVQQLLLGVGFAASYPAINITGLVHTRESEHGLASGIITSAFQIGGGIILAITASIFAASSQIGLAPYHAGLLLVVVLAATQVVLAIVLGRREKTRDLAALAASE